VIAGAIGGAFALFVLNDRPERESTLSVRARFAPPR
jgi:hypothetical protein